MVLIPPNNKFTLFTNSTAFRQAAAAGNASGLPSTINTLSMAEFISRLHGNMHPLYYPSESYYWQQEPPPDFGIDAAFAVPPVSCFNTTEPHPGEPARSAERRGSWHVRHNASLQLDHGDWNCAHIAAYREVQPTCITRVHSFHDCKILRQGQTVDHPERRCA